MASDGAKSRWGWAVAGGLLAFGLILALFRAPLAPPPPVGRIPTTVQLDRSPALADEALLFDPEPLFLPTRWNASPRMDALKRFEQSATFRDYGPKWEFDDNALKLSALGMPSPVKLLAPLADNPGELLAADPPGALAAGMGNRDLPNSEMTFRGGQMEVISVRDGQRVLVQTLGPNIHPNGKVAWVQPVEYMAAVNSAGLVGALVLTTHSGSDEIDLFFQSYLTRTLRLGEQLRPGYYRICVGP